MSYRPPGHCRHGYSAAQLAEHLCTRCLLDRVRAAEQRAAEAERELTKTREAMNEWAQQAERAESALAARHGGEPIALLRELDQEREKRVEAERVRDMLGEALRSVASDRPSVHSDAVWERMQKALAALGAGKGEAT